MIRSFLALAESDNEVFEKEERLAVEQTTEGEGTQGAFNSSYEDDEESSSQLEVTVDIHVDNQEAGVYYNRPRKVQDLIVQTN